MCYHERQKRVARQKFCLSLLIFCSLKPTHTHSHTHLPLTPTDIRPHPSQCADVLHTMEEKEYKLIVRGGRRLGGVIPISGMKNAALPILFACALNKEPCILQNVPMVKDIETTIAILTAMGVTVRYLAPTTVEINGAGFRSCVAPPHLVSKIRASSYLMGAELGRTGRTCIVYPGGCDFQGGRPLDLHIGGFEAMGAEMTTTGVGYVGETPDGLKPAKINLRSVSVGATVNLILAATLTPGTTIISNAAREPHIVSLACFLNACGACITGAGTSDIHVQGVKTLHGCTYRIPPDMIEAGTYMAAVAGVGGSVKLTNVYPEHLRTTTDMLREMGVEIIENVERETLTVNSTGKLKAIRIQTSPYPGFPTDMQPQLGALMTVANGVSEIEETVINGRFAYLGELRKMGARTIGEAEKSICIIGVDHLVPAVMRAGDLRGGAAMVIAALMADGVSEITNVKLIDRGYDDIEGKLTALGADIVRVVDGDTVHAGKASPSAIG